MNEWMNELRKSYPKISMEEAKVIRTVQPYRLDVKWHDTRRTLVVQCVTGADLENVRRWQNPLALIPGLYWILLTYDGPEGIPGSVVADYANSKGIANTTYRTINEGKWRNILHYLKTFEALNQYDLFWFPDPDIRMTPAAVRAFLAIVKEEGTQIAQPALTEDSICSHDHLRHEATPDPLRAVDFVEVMAPAFHRGALARKAWTFGLTASGYGIDILWGQAIVVDAIQMKHPGLPTFETKAAAMGFPDPNQEGKEVLGVYGEFIGKDPDPIPAAQTKGS